MNKLRLAFMSAALFAAAGAGYVYSQGSLGFWSNWPILGNPGFCSSSVNATCVQQIPAGTATVTGNETIPLDTLLPGGQFPQSERVQIATLFQHGQGSSRNALIGSDFATNLWQRGTTPISATTASTTKMSADRWAAYSSGNTLTITKDTTAADLSPSLGINAAMKITRPSGTNTTAICVGQVLPQADSLRFLAASNGSTGAQVIFSFYANPLSGFLSTNNNIIANIAVYTATDSATPGTNTDSFMKGTTTGYTVINPTSATVATAPVIPLATGWARYSVTGIVPATISTNAVTGIGVTICTPVYPASTGVATDGFLIANAQLETGIAANATTGQLAQTTPGSYARRLPADEVNEQLTYSYVLTDGAITRAFPGFCTETTANTSATCSVPFGIQLRIVPTTTVSAAGWSIQQASNNADELCSALAGVATSNTVNSAALLCTNPGTMAVGLGSAFYGGATTSTITFSAEP